MKNRGQKFYGARPLTVALVIFSVEGDNLKVLLTRKVHEPFRGHWVLPGDFLAKNETTKRAAMRILEEKVGRKDVYIEQLFTFDSPTEHKGSRVLTVTYFALVPREKILLGPRHDVRALGFFPVQKLPALAFDHKEIIRYAAKRLRAKLEYTNAVFSLLPASFTLFQLQKTYEIILGKPLDKRNFRKKFLSLGLIRSTKKFIRKARQRPALLYEFISRTPAELKKFF